MNTKVMMLSSAAFMAVMGLSLSFLPEEMGVWVGLPSSLTSTLVLQVVGAQYLGFAFLNWMAKASLLGGIYNRPIVMANFAHFFISGLALLKASFHTQASPLFWGLATAIYAVYGLLFGIILFRHPLKATANTPS